MKRRGFLIGAAGIATLGVSGAWAWRTATGSMSAYRRYAAGLRAPLPRDPAPSDLVRYAALAANGHNTQPWSFAVLPGEIRIRPDFLRSTPAVDPDDHHLFVSLGCAAENLRIAAEATGHPGEIAIEETGAIRYVFSNGASRPDPLFDAIPRRQSTRADFSGTPVSAADLKTLAEAAETPGVDLAILTDRPAIDRVRDLVLAGNDEQMADPAFMAELRTWLRFNPADALARGDGLFAASSGNPVLPDLLAAPAFDLFFTAKAERQKYARQIDTSPGIAVFTGEREDRVHWVAVGRACQRFALAATSLGLCTSFINQPVEVAALRPDLAAIAGVAGRRPDIVMRFGRGPQLPFSPRRPVESLLT
ncbi:putative NAD(P)H nitroreductase [Hartmannibacter diazotrophicus]|uniref:Putative NAD(P)H nitroreductase n=1 Tax=Hartmannibacter diazotrophicus TaxID=1482074 RepID=A0A2C9D089_9HYPH|nr:nitroreductase family protein [Hartmannibacter diazotrophicus]SON53742.1 putative NAD(P)H nitroreductase [Hartmannibacter diazotrophicus]